jgi:hypothetical protein
MVTLNPRVDQPMVHLTTFGELIHKSKEMSENVVEGGNKEGNITVTWENLRVAVLNGSKKKESNSAVMLNLEDFWLLWVLLALENSHFLML